MTKTLTLTEFLLARIAEDEAVAREAMANIDRIEYVPEMDVDDLRHTRCLRITDPDDEVSASPGRVLAECEAKRRIVQEVERLRSMIPAYVLGDGDEHEAVIVEWADSAVLRALASAYADHPDFREEWRA